MSRIFISYSSKSKDVVGSLAHDIESTGHQIWFDHKLTGGQAWWDQILENIRLCDLFVFALTPEALDSYPCQLEYTYAHQLGKNILPVLVADGVSIGLLPSELTSIQFVDYRTPDRQAAFRLMSAFTSLPAPKPLPDLLPAPPPVPISYIGNLKEQIDSSKGLSFDEQASLVLKLKEHLREDDSRPDAVTLLERLKRRDDLFAKIEKEIDAVLGTADVKAAPKFTGAATRLQLPRVNRVAKQKVEVVPGNNPSAESEVPRRLLWQLTISAGLIWGIGNFMILMTGGFAGRIDSLLLFGGSAYLIHGIVTGLILRTLASSPPPITIAWLLRTALMGGPFNVLLLRRVVPTIKLWQIVLYFGGWVIGLMGIFGGALLYFMLVRLRRSQ